jgi:hypothetical protein
VATTTRRDLPTTAFLVVVWAVAFLGVVAVSLVKGAVPAGMTELLVGTKLLEAARFVGKRWTTDPAVTAADHGVGA